MGERYGNIYIPSVVPCKCLDSGTTIAFSAPSFQVSVSEDLSSEVLGELTDFSDGVREVQDESGTFCCT